MAAPFVIWFALHVIARRFSVDLHPVLPWLRRLQWAAWGTAVALFIAAMVANNDGIFPYACAATSISPALSIAEKALTRRFAPDQIERDDPAEEWWPTKRD
jgi:hypothetical protein